MIFVRFVKGKLMDFGGLSGVPVRISVLGCTKPKATNIMTLNATAHASLDLRLVGKIQGLFFVPKYQRGYRWGPPEVVRLLDDIWNSEGKPYSLQPIVVKQRDQRELGAPEVPFEDKQQGAVQWELIDGQQRLTTLYLIFLYVQQEVLRNGKIPYSLQYETRPNSEAYLKLPDPTKAKDNIDFYHIYHAYECIKKWFEAQDAPQFAASEFYGYLFKNIRVIWYEAPGNTDAITLFRRLNVGRIPLTDAELIKATLLSEKHNEFLRRDRIHELVAQWDAIERDLRDPDVWAFVTQASADEYPTRITLLLDILAGGAVGRERPRFYTFDTLQKRIETTSPSSVWNSVLDLHALVIGWFEDRNLYHKIGYLVAVGSSFGALVERAKGKTKKELDASLNLQIKDLLKSKASELSELNYSEDYEKCHRLLLLMNVETIRRLKDSTERYPFRRHHGAASKQDGALSWSLEHIHAQQAQGLTKAEQWREWLNLHKEALSGFPCQSEMQQRREALIRKIETNVEKVDRQLFDWLAKEVTEFFTDTSSTNNAHSVHSISNLALLPGSANSALSNSVFEVKRRKIIELDRKGAFIPICTRQIFLKYYTESNALQLHFWGIQDRENYLNAIHNLLEGYLQPEVQP
jgi:uncharacterized protein with ParB-like and HNH nuclease domain